MAETIEVTGTPVPMSEAQLRQKLQDTVLADQLGQANGRTEIVDEPSVRDRYLIGRLGPKGQRWQDAEDETIMSLEEADGELDTGGIGGEEGIAEAGPPQVVSVQPSSMGLSFVAAGDTQSLRITARWGHYVREEGKGEEYKTSSGTQRRIWRRIPVEDVTENEPLREGCLRTWRPNPEQPEARVEGLVRRRADQWHITLFLVNGQTSASRTRTRPGFSSRN